jgi:hypothetical protein
VGGIPLFCTILKCQHSKREQIPFLCYSENSFALVDPHEESRDSQGCMSCARRLHGVN